MRFKIDENLPQALTSILKERGYEAETVLEQGMGGYEDVALMSECKKENRILITLDIGFADIRTYRPGSYPGIVVLRPARQDINSIMSLGRSLLKLLGSRAPEGLLWVLDEGRLRVRGS